MRIILYNPRFPTNHHVPPELDALPPSDQTSPAALSSASAPSHGMSTTMQTIPTTNIYTNGTSNGLNTATSTIYRVSTTGISVQPQPTPHSSSRPRVHYANEPHRQPRAAGSHHHQRSTSGNTQGSAQAKHHKSSSGGGESGLDRSTTPTQSNTLAQAKRPQLDELSPRDLGSLTQEQIAQLQANMLEDLQDADARPLVSTVQPMETLMNEYSSNPNFLRKMEWLKKQGWLGVRRTKGDGDCFYRSFAFAWVERILRAKDQEFAVASAISTLNSTWLGLKDVGFETVILEDFYDVLRSLVEQIITPEAGGQALNASLLLEAFTSPEASNSIVSYVRMLTSAEIRRNREDYAAFIVHPETQEAMPVDEFCNQFVDAMGKEADHVQMQALAKALGVNLSVAYLDGNIGSNNDDAAVDFVKFDNGGGSDANGIDDVVLLYRPGHYDILEHRAHEHRPSAASTLVTSSVMA